jgi:threonine dehydrogenase-like Zn-dependent dehydrogenase
LQRGGATLLIGVYGGMADPLPMLTLFDKQVTLRMGQANVKKWVDDIMPLLTEDDPLGRRYFCHSCAASRSGSARLRDPSGVVKVTRRP